MPNRSWEKDVIASFDARREGERLTKPINATNRSWEKDVIASFDSRREGERLTKQRDAKQILGEGCNCII